MTLALRYAARSHTGLLRSGNEDSAYAGPRVLAVADGMGGHAAGEVASAVAIASLAQLDEDAPGPDLTALLRSAAVGANDSLRDMVAGDLTLEGMGTTLTAVLFTGTRLGLLHIGDSRCYLLRDGVLSQITHDDTLVQSLVDEGRIDEEEASTHPQRSLITRALDGRTGIDFDTSVREALPGDRYLLCTDGLTGPVGRLETLLEALQIPEPQDAVDRLVELALRGGGPDNVTVIVADVIDRSAPLPPIVVGAADEAPQPSPAHLSQGAAGRAAAHRLATPARASPVARDDTGSPSDHSPRSHRRPPDRRRRLALAALALPVLLAVALVGSWLYVRAQWYVGAQDTNVAVYRGVAGQVAGVDLYSLEQRTAVVTTTLPELDLESVRRGIRADDRADADRIVASLAGRAMTPTPAVTPTPTRTPVAAPTSRAPARTSPSPVPRRPAPAAPSPARTP